MRSYKMEYLVGQCLGMNDGVLSLAKEFSDCSELHGFATFHDAAEALLGFFRTAMNRSLRVKEQAAALVEKEYTITARFEELCQRIETLQEELRTPRQHGRFCPKVELNAFAKNTKPDIFNRPRRLRMTYVVDVLTKVRQAVA